MQFDDIKQCIISDNITDPIFDDYVAAIKLCAKIRTIIKDYFKCIEYNDAMKNYNCRKSYCDSTIYKPKCFTDEACLDAFIEHFDAITNLNIFSKMTPWQIYVCERRCLIEGYQGCPNESFEKLIQVIDLIGHGKHNINYLGDVLNTLCVKGERYKIDLLDQHFPGLCWIKRDDKGNIKYCEFTPNYVKKMANAIADDEESITEHESIIAAHKKTIATLQKELASVKSSVDHIWFRQILIFFALVLLCMLSCSINYQMKFMIVQ